MNKVTTSWLLALGFTVGIFGQNPAAENVTTYSPKEAKFTINIPGIVGPAKSGAPLYGANSSVFRVIQPHKKAKLFHRDSVRDGKRSFSLSILQLSLGSTEAASFLNDEQVENLSMMIGDDIVLTTIEKRLQGDVKWTSWSYAPQRSMLDKPWGQVYALWKTGDLIILVISYHWGNANDPEIRKMIEFFSALETPSK